MIPMKDFDREQMHGKVLLLRRRDTMLATYALAYYDKVRDIFYAVNLPFMNTEKVPWEVSPYTEITVESDKLGEVQCVMPKNFQLPTGINVFSSFMLLSEVLDSLADKNAFRDDIEKVLKKAKTFDQYLVITKQDRLCISSIGTYTGPGIQFSMNTPQSRKGQIYDAQGAMPVDMIRCVANLAEWEAQYENRLANVDELYKDIAAMDLSYMQQGDVMECIRDCIERHLRKRGTAK